MTGTLRLKSVDLGLGFATVAIGLFMAYFTFINLPMAIGNTAMHTVSVLDGVLMGVMAFLVMAMQRASTGVALRLTFALMIVVSLLALTNFFA